MEQTGRNDVRIGRGGWWLLLLLCVAAVALRIGPVRDVFNGGLRLIDPDSYYHLRLIRSCIDNFPTLLSYDPFLSFPRGDIQPWPPLFDLIAAAIALPFPHPLQVIPAVNLLMGVTTVGAAYLWLMPRRGLRTAFLTAALLAGGGILCLYQSFGRVDHHAFEILLVVLWHMAFISFVREPAMLPGTLLAIVTTATFFVWPGAFVYFPPALSVLAVRSVRDRCDVRAAAGISISFLAAAAALTVWLHAGPQRPYEFRTLSAFQRDICLLATLGAALLWARQRGSVPFRYGLPAVAIIAAIAFRPLFVELAEGVLFVGRHDRSMVMSIETAPLFLSGTVSFAEEFRRALEFFTPLVVLLPLLCIGYARSGAPAEMLVMTLYFLALTLVQVRFGYFFMAGFAFVAGEALASLRRLLPMRVVVPAFAILCTIQSYRDLAMDWEGFPSDQMVRAMAFLRGRTPQAAAFDQGAAPYGVLGSWQAGNYIIALGNRPAVAHNAVGVTPNNGYRRFMQALHADSEDAVTTIMDDVRSPFLVLEDPASDIVTAWGVLHDGPNPFGTTGGRPSPAASRLFLNRLFLFDGVTPPFDATPRHLRLVFEARDDGGGRSDDTIKVYERVTGARIVSGADGILVAEVTTGGRTIRFRWAGRKTGEGFEFVLPYSIDAPYDVRLVSANVESGGARRAVTVTERDVREGRTVRMP